jgi:prepilin-type N-terminal cleavage/methylation domain-containing protein
MTEEGIVVSELRRAVRGFTLIEILVALAIVAVIAAVSIPALHSHIEESRIKRMAVDLTSIAQAIREYEKHVGTYPTDLSELTTQPVAGTDKNSCGVILTGPEVALWKGPYLPSAAPYIEGEDTIFGNLKRKNGSTKNPDILQIAVRQPPMTTALKLDSLFDGDGDLSAGTITWNTNVFPQGQMLYSEPIQGC